MILIHELLNQIIITLYISCEFIAILKLVDKQKVSWNQITIEIMIDLNIVNKQSSQNNKHQVHWCYVGHKYYKYANAFTQI